MEAKKPRWEVERDRVNARPPAQIWVYQQWWFYSVIGFGLAIAAYADDDRAFLAPAAVAFPASAFGYRHRS